MNSASGPHAAITATGYYFPEHVLRNDYFYRDLGLDTSEEWIVSRTGVRERRMARLEKGETCASLSVEAARRCLEARGMDAADIDAIVLATISGDLGFPATACLVQDRLGAKNAFAFDLSAACAGYLYGAFTAASYVESGRFERVLVIGAEQMSAILDYTDRSTCVIFGDGAGATLVERVPAEHPGRMIDWILRTDGAGARSLYRTGGGALHLPGAVNDRFARSEKVTQDGRAIFKTAVQKMTEVVEEILRRNGITLEDVDLVIPHQANIRIIDAACERLGCPREKVAIYVDRYANTTAATLPTSLAMKIEEGALEPGGLVLFCTFGAGFTWGAALVRWGGIPGKV